LNFIEEQVSPDFDEVKEEEEKKKEIVDKTPSQILKSIYSEIAENDREADERKEFLRVDNRKVKVPHSKTLDKNMRLKLNLDPAKKAGRSLKVEKK
jgi:BioD-like phosphotransacetylase family protein